MKKIFKKKLQRLLVSKNMMKILFGFHFLTGGYKSKKIDISFKNKKNRLEIVQNILNLKKYRSYLEIGTFKNDLFNHVKCNVKVGVDPVSGGNIRKTSDAFFSENNQKFDLIFIDGLHHYEQVKRDIFNSLKFLNSKGIILLHDCLPRNYYYQAVPRSQINWNGDTWKAFLEIRNQTMYDTYCCNADEGIGVILKRDNLNPLNMNIKSFQNFNFNKFVTNYKKYLNLVEYESLIKILKEYE